MSFADRLFGLAKGSLLLSESVDRLVTSVNELGKEVREHDRRLVRIETLLEFGIRRPSPQRLTDE